VNILILGGDSYLGWPTAMYAAHRRGGQNSRHLEPIDIENDEHLFWDAAGVACKVMLTGRVGWFHNPNVSGLCKAQNPITLQEAREWASQLGCTSGYDWNT
jgi:hypothetical protein